MSCLHLILSRRNTVVHTRTVPDVSLATAAEVYASDAKVILTGVVSSLSVDTGEDGSESIALSLTCDQVPHCIDTRVVCYIYYFSFSLP